MLMLSMVLTLRFFIICNINEVKVSICEALTDVTSYFDNDKMKTVL